MYIASYLIYKSGSNLNNGKIDYMHAHFTYMTFKWMALSG